MSASVGKYVRSVVPYTGLGRLLPGAQFSDAYSVVVEADRLNAREAAERMLADAPRWIDALMAGRDRMMSPFGVKTAQAARSQGDTVGIFPIVGETARRIIVGLDDRHLDFRVIVDVAAVAQGRRVTATTIVRTHNRLGRIYLAAILPFHRLIVRTLLRRSAARPRPSLTPPA